MITHKKDGVGPIQHWNIDDVNTRKGKGRFFFTQYQCMKCYGDHVHVPSYICDHMAEFIHEQQDLKEYVLDMRSIGVLTAVVSHIVGYSEYEPARNRLHSDLLFGLHFPDLEANGTYPSETLHSADLWLVTTYDDGGGTSYRFAEMIEADIAFGNMFDMSMKRVRTIGLNKLVEAFYSGIACEQPMHSVHGGIKEIQPGSRRSVSDKLHRRADVLADVASLLARGKCQRCFLNRESLVGLADF